MSVGLESMTVAEWVNTQLLADADLIDMAGDAETLADRLWEGEYQGSESEAPWWITWTLEDGVDIKGVGLIQVMARAVIQVKVVARGAAYEPAMPVYSRVHELLESKTNQPTIAGLVLECGRVSTFQFPERTDGMEYRHLGGRYEALAQ